MSGKTELRSLRPKRDWLKDGRMSSKLGRRLLAGAVKHPGQLIPMETLAREVWPDGPPKTWRVCLPHLALQINARIGAMVLERVGTARRIDGFRLHVKNLPNWSVTRRRSRPPRARVWSSAEDAVLREHAGRKPLSELTALVNAVHGHDRRVTGVEGRIYFLGLSKRIRAFSANSLAPILGISGEKITRWIARGLLKARRSEPDGWQEGSKRYGWWVIEQPDVEAFLREYPWEVDWRTMQPGHPLTGIAVSVQRSNPYLTLDQAARRSGLSSQTIVKRIVAGDLQGAVRVTPHSPRSSPELSTWRIPLSALAGIPRDKRRRQPASTV